MHREYSLLNFCIFHLFVFATVNCDPYLKLQGDPAISDKQWTFDARSQDPCLGTAAKVGEKVCIARGVEYNSNTMFPHVTGCYCYWYMNPVLRKPNITNIRMTKCSGTDFKYPCIRLPDNSTLPFNYSNSTTVEVLGDTFLSTDTINKWLQCSKSAISCCDDMEENDVHPDEGNCPANWDGWTCWNKAPIQTTQEVACPDFSYAGELPTCQQYGSNKCLDTGKWFETTDYGTCSSNPLNMMRERIEYHIIVLYVSIALSLPALIIFFSYRKLRIKRVILHRNLIMFIILAHVITIVSEKVIMLDSLNDITKEDKVMTMNSVWCRTISFMMVLLDSAVYSCMLMEGVFLHRLIAAAFRGEPDLRYYYAIAIGFAVIPIGIWATLTALYYNVNCWAVDTTEYRWIIDGPRILTISINVLLMLDIVRVLFTKLRRINTNKSRHIRQMTRATILLTPLFGIQIFFTLGRPGTKDCGLEQAYYYISYTLDGLQGVLVCLSYCYLNKEAQMQLLGTYNQLMVRLYRLRGKDFIAKHRPTWAYSEHRPTATSLVLPDELMRSSISMPNTTINSDLNHNEERKIRSSFTAGNVTSILSHKTGNHPHQVIKAFPRSSLVTDGSHFNPHHPHPIHNARQRKVSAVNEETDVQEQKPEMPKLPSTKAHDSDEEVMAQTPELYEVDDLEVFDIQEGDQSPVVNLGFSISSEHIADENGKVRHRSSSRSASIDESNA